MSQLAFFFHDAPLIPGHTLSLQEDTVKHIVLVLRKKEGEQIGLCNGKGTIATCEIAATSKKNCTVTVLNARTTQPKSPGLTLAVAFTKNASRNEWLLEKATELGVSTIYPLISERSEREKFREDRARNILISAMLQSQQSYLPELAQAADWETIVQRCDNIQVRLLAHCDPQFTRTPISKALPPGKDCLIFIGPEGDFSPEEINEMNEAGFTGVSLCNQRLRTETAAMAVCAYFNLSNET